METIKELIDYINYNKDTGIFTWVKKTSPMSNVVIGDIAGSLDTRGRRQIWVKGKAYLAHNIAWYFSYNEYPIRTIIHKDSDSDNNKLDNLELVTDIEGLELTQETLQLLFNYKEDEGIFIRKVSINSQAKVGSIAGGKTKNGYILIPIGKKREYAHRLAWLYKTGKEPINMIDHINGIKDDNRWCNLREATASQNAFNSKISTNNRTGVKGVFWVEKSNTWRASIKLEGKTINIGTYKTLEEAKAKIEEARIKYHELEYLHNG